MIDNIIEKASVIPTLTDLDERELLAELASNVPPNTVILEIGGLYGGVTAVLALSAPHAAVYTIDNFSWHPEGFPKTSKQLLETNMHDLGIYNVTVIEGKSQDVVKKWTTPISLLWIDGGHDFKTVYSDLFHFSVYADVIALHDYGNPAWRDIRQAIDRFTFGQDVWYLDKVVGMVAVLRKKAK
jgi:precorrin-6B methylase 2